MKKTKLVLIGYGNMGKDWGKIIKTTPNIELVGVVDTLKQNRNIARNFFSLTTSQTSDSLIMMLSRFNPDIVMDCSSPQAHAENTRLALNHSCHVLGEKPMATTLVEAEKLISLAETKRRIYMVNQNYRRNPIIEIVKDKMKVIGKIDSVHIDYYQSLEFKDTFRYKLTHPLLLDMSIHHFDLLRYITGREAISVQAFEYNPVTSKFKDGSNAIVNFKMSGDANFSYRGSWSSIGCNTSFNGQWRIIGEYGTLLWDGDFNLLLEKRINNGKIYKEIVSIPAKLKLKPYKLFLYELERNLELFLTSISTGNLPDCWCGDNINSLKMVLSAIKSSEASKVINLKFDVQE